MYSNKLYTPLRYPGGKARFAPLITDILQSNQLLGGHYLEPYAGGAGVALILLFDGIVEHVHINDADPAIADFWRAATKDTQALMSMVADEPVDMDAWHHWKDVMLGNTKATDLERGFATLFLNRTNRSGILKGGVIGGKSQSGAYKIGERFKRQQLCERLEKIGSYAKTISVYQEDAFDLLIKCKSFLPKNSLIYLDPPYYVKGAGLYRNFYKHEDHLKIANSLRKLDFDIPWIVSYDNATEIRDMYAYARSFTYGLRYTAQNRYVGSEVMFFRDGLILPASIEDSLAA